MRCRVGPSDYLQQFADEWSTRGVRAWHEGWWEIGRTTGDLLAPIVGAAAGTISMHQNVTVAQAIVASCHRYDSPRRRIVMSDLEFPSNMYLFEGFRRYGAEIIYVPSGDGMRTNLDRLLDAIDERTALVPVSLVLFKSAFIENAAAIVEKAHRVGARVILDIYQAAGTVPVNLEALRVDFAVGGSVKWLCGGPGAGYLYVRPDLAREVRARYRRVGCSRSAVSVRDRTDRVRGCSRALPERHAERAGAVFLPRRIRDRSRNWRRCDPRQVAAIDASSHGSRLSGRFPSQYAASRPRARRHRHHRRATTGASVTDELIERGVIVDYRPGAGIRVAPHFYNTIDEIDHAMRELCDVIRDPGVS